jgi:hypothetical protein
MGRRRGRTEPPKPFADAFNNIDTLEQNVIRRTVDAQFTPEQVVRWLFPDDVTDRLKAAYSVTRDVDRGNRISEDVTLPVVFPAVSCTIDISAKSVSMLVPAPHLCKLQDGRGEQIIAAIRGVYEHHERFEKVRKVVSWLNEYATVGAARHYCPWMAGILPAEHPFHTAGGTIYREPSMSMVGIMGAMRESGAIMAGALLCGEGGEAKTKVVVSFDGVRVTPRGSQDTYTSKEFGLL